MPKSLIFLACLDGGRRDLRIGDDELQVSIVGYAEGKIVPGTVYSPSSTRIRALLLAGLVDELVGAVVESMRGKPVLLAIRCGPIPFSRRTGQASP